MRKGIIYTTISIIIILMIPLVAKLPWTLEDFLVAGVLLFGTGLMLTLVTNKLKDKKKKIFAAMMVLFLFVYIWAELAVGIFTKLGS